MKLWDTSNLVQSVFHARVPGYSSQDLQHAHDGDSARAGDRADVVKLWDLRKNDSSLVHCLSNARPTCHSCQYLRHVHGWYLAHAGDRNDVVKLWYTPNLVQSVFHARVPGYSSQDLQHVHDGDSAHAGDRDDVVKLWDLRKASLPTSQIRPAVLLFYILWIWITTALFLAIICLQC